VSKAAISEMYSATPRSVPKLQQLQAQISEVCDLKITCSLGGGGGQVYKVKNSKGEVQVLKLFRGVEDCYGPCNPYELAISTSFRHPNLTSFESLMVLNSDTPVLGAVMSCASMTLIDVMLSTTIDFEQRLRYILQAVRGLAFLHENGFLHLDVKVDNVLVSNGTAKLADFGHSCRMDSNGVLVSNLSLMTMLYRPPELLGTTPPYTYSVKSESWTLGHLLVMTCFGSSFFSNECYKNQALGVQYILHEFEQQKVNIIHQYCTRANFRSCNVPASHVGISPSNSITARLQHMEKLLNSLFSYSPSQRMSAAEVVKHPLFSGMNEPELQGEVAVRERYFPPPDTKDYIDMLCELMHTKWPGLTSRLLFITVDIYVRASVFTCYSSLNSCRVAKLRMVTAAACCWIAHKMIGSSDIAARKILCNWASTTESHINTVELEVIVGLRGNISPSYIYELCEGANHLRISYFNVLRGNPDTYADLDLQRWREIMGPARGIPHLTIAELHRNLDM